MPLTQTRGALWLLLTSGVRSHGTGATATVVAVPLPFCPLCGAFAVRVGLTVGVPRRDPLLTLFRRDAAMAWSWWLV